LQHNYQWVTNIVSLPLGTDLTIEQSVSEAKKHLRPTVTDT
jgi:hypothetical protein